MADYPSLRQEEHSADPEGFAAMRAASPVRAGVLVTLAATAFLAVALLVAGAPSFIAPAFLDDALGPETPAAPLTRKPAPGIDVRIDSKGYTVARSGESISVVAEDVGGAEWRRHVHGVSRPTEFGSETIVVDGSTTESFLTVAERQGLRTWRWRLETRLVPRVRADGAVEFRDPTLHAVSPLSVKAVAILDADGKDITPAGVRWQLVRADDAWWLHLRLDDADLPLPYVIDPATG